MKRVFLVVSVLSLLMSTHLIVLAQDGPELKECSSSNGKLTLSYPPEWFVEEIPSDDEYLLAGVELFNDESLVNVDEITLETGQVQITIILFPATFFALFGFEVTDDTTPQDLVATFAGFVEMDGVHPELGEPQTIEVSDSLEAGYITLAYSDSEEALISFEVQDDVFALVFVSVYPGEFSDDVKTLAFDITASVKYAETFDESAALVLCDESFSANETLDVGVELAPGIELVAFGTDFDNTEDCNIIDPLSDPIVYPEDTSQIAFQVVIDPAKVNSVDIRIDGDLSETGFVMESCDKYSISMGSPVQTQFGGVISLGEGELFNPGEYILVITTDGNTTEIPFRVE